ncbi:bombyxin D-1 [Bombyx mandarina]|uniref:Bombyxin D-1 n=1 Tax=Bombyx mandarina TaxID=7092 RepID=A0A6J2KDU3_BOMMA|nr:bombyxin D-1 [Bombyx mandarina]BAA20145.1 prepro-bombyxin D1'(K) [Bombyx mori]
MKLLGFFLSWVSVCAIVSASEERHIYCGRYLAYKMADLCWRAGFEKRSVAHYAGYGWPLLPSLSEERGKRGIADECCLQPCTNDVLLSYC